MKKILVIEDEPEMRRNLTTVLRLEKFEPLAAGNGREGVELARKQRPDLILCDVMMPELDGYGVIAALRADAKRLAGSISTATNRIPIRLLLFMEEVVEEPHRCDPLLQCGTRQTGG